MADPRRHDHPDDRLAARLETALHDELGRGHVDVAELIRGTRRGSRRARVRRNALVAATAAVVAAVPIAIATMESRPSGHATTPTTASGGTPTPTATPPPATGSPAPAPEPTRTAVDTTATPPGGTPIPPDKASPVTVPSPAIRYGLPAAVRLTTDQLGLAGLRLQYADTETNAPTASGQGCGALPETRQAVARRFWMWTAVGGAQVEQTVTAWRDSRAAFSALVTNTGACRLPDGMKDWPTGEQDPDLWAGVGPVLGPGGAVAARRLDGDVVVAVTVSLPTGEEQSAKLALRLVEAAAERAGSAGVAALG